MSFYTFSMGGSSPPGAKDTKIHRNSGNGHTNCILNVEEKIVFICQLGESAGKMYVYLISY